MATFGVTGVSASYLGRHYGSLEVLRPYSRRPVADGHEVLVLRGVPLYAVDGTVVLARTHVKHADTVVLLPVSKIDLRRFQNWTNRAKCRRVGKSEGMFLAAKPLSRFQVTIPDTV